MYFWYSESVVAPMARSSPRASAGLSMLDASIAPSAAPAPISVCSSSMKRMIVPCGLLDLLEDGLEPVLELAPVLGARDHRAEVEGHDALVLQALRDVAHVDPPGEALDDRRLADARLADQDRVVLRPPGEDLDHAPDLLVAADDGIDLAAPGQVGEVARVALQGLVLVLGVGVGDARRAPDLLQGLEQRVLLDPGPGQALGGLAGVGLRQGHQEVLGRDVLVAELLGDLEGAVEDAVQLPGDLGVGRGAGDLGPPLELALDLAGEGLGVRAELLEDRRDDAVLLLEQGEQEVIGASARRCPGRARRAAPPGSASWALMVSWSKRMMASFSVRDSNS